ncbi:hypothetical protein CFC21_105768 [Triticum aestivum]|uniref:Uncharacterized protein n=2 Tax=Triticum aestivum TaxID=4565 RepID=A0A9R1N8S7_WHEAT|nr:uncharacterized protein LOC123162245 [Triticum aestivum]KAF7104909.1 hypothetical protein CFC21_105768 [Triticum aestivum]
MKKIISDDGLPSSSSAETTKGKGQPSPAPAAGSAAHLDGGDDKVFQHVLVTLVMFVCFVMYALLLWSGLGHWYNVIFTAITFLYSMVMIHLWLIKRRDQKKTCETEACELTTVISTPGARELMLLATGIMLISLGVAIFVFRPDSYDLAFVALTVFLSTTVTFVSLEEAKVERKPSEELSAASDLV